MSARHAINCAVTAYHMHEWVWGDWLKKDFETLRKLAMASFLSWIDANEPFFRTIQAVANGSKHFDRLAIERTRVARTVDAATFDRDAFDAARLEVQIDAAGDGSTHLLAEVLLNNLVVFWCNFLTEYGPYKDLPAAKFRAAMFVAQPLSSPPKVGQSAYRSLQGSGRRSIYCPNRARCCLGMPSH